MAEEGLDIKTLTTLIMATPRVDVRQAVGRILRKKHDNAEVYDIIDTHPIFQRHWKKRQTFYRKSNFKIFLTTNQKYLNNDWDCIYDKKTKKKAPKKNKSSSKKVLEIKTDPLFQGKCLI